MPATVVIARARADVPTTRAMERPAAPAPAPDARAAAPSRASRAKAARGPPAFVRVVALDDADADAAGAPPAYARDALARAAITE